MVVGNVPEAADFVVVGAGPGGYAAALHAARSGRRVLLVDRDGRSGVGGVCLRVGCIPSKALIEAAGLNLRARTSASMGVPPAMGDFDMQAFQIWKTEVVDGLTRGVSALLDSAGVEVAAGVATLTEPAVMVISTPGEQARFVQFRDLVIATGSAPLALPDLPFDGKAVLDSSDVLALETIPESLAVIGAGYIGLELGTALAKVGCRVSVIEAEPRILPTLASELCAPVQRRLGELGIEVHLGARATGYDGRRLQVVEAGGAYATVEAEKVLVAIGRRANAEGFGLEVIDARLDGAGRVPVAADRRVSEHIAAIGDLTSGPALAHKATAEAAVAVSALGGERVGFEPAAVPAIVFSDPEVATAGLSADDAGSAGVDLEVSRVPLGASGRAATLGASNGFAQIVSDREDGTILGVHIVGPHASELIAEGVLAIEMGVTLEDLSLVIHPHPTLAEQWAETAQLGVGRPLHVR